MNNSNVISVRLDSDESTRRLGHAFSTEFIAPILANTATAPSSLVIVTYGQRNIGKSSLLKATTEALGIDFNFGKELSLHTNGQALFRHRDCGSWFYGWVKKQPFDFDSRNPAHGPGIDFLEHAMPEQLRAADAAIVIRNAKKPSMWGWSYRPEKEYLTRLQEIARDTTPANADYNLGHLRDAVSATYPAKERPTKLPISVKEFEGLRRAADVILLSTKPEKREAFERFRQHIIRTMPRLMG